MPRVKIGPALPDREKLDAEIARLRDLDVGQLRSRWHTAFGRPAPAHLARHLLFRSLAYRLQADRLGDLDRESQRLLATRALRWLEPDFGGGWRQTLRHCNDDGIHGRR